MKAQLLMKSSVAIAATASCLLLSPPPASQACMLSKSQIPSPQTTIPAIVGWGAIAFIGGSIVVNEATR
ncbi:MAG: hypothetical protein SAJ12_00355 [Jaaginema sp. PMC 1079.18]|nr:hypothetical protein [Jaaginema sp. PMC 1080.18]MEC4849434.1 hypothetical protein [Jaaginema sp. PMC 1079.18]MEC4864934.1 hypothetical protein [Jaaginema sp. PMC 1078.18]